MSRWFRFYDEAINDPKVQRLEPRLFKTWVNLLCIASKHEGKLPGICDIAFALRRDEAAIGHELFELREAGFLDIERGVLRPHNWDKWQYKRDDSKLRTQEWRARQRDGHGDGAVTVPEQRQKQKQKQKQRQKQTPDQNKPDQTLCAGAPERGTRLPEDWKVSDALQAWVKKQGLRVDWRAETEQFRDYWLSKAGANGRKLNWDRTWQVWMRNAESKLPRERNAPALAPHDDEAQWRRRLEGFKANALWLEAWGARPGERLCQAPQGLLAQYGFADEAA